MAITQKYDSADTSIAQICAIYTNFTKPKYYTTGKKVGPKIFAKGDNVLDWGGGKYDLGKEYMAGYGINVSVYDPFNRSAAHNNAVLRKFKTKRPDVIVCSNVLNVIAEDHVIRDLIKNIRKYTGPNTLVIFSVYEGNRSSIGHPTTKGYQRNEPTINYLRFLSGFRMVTKKGKFIICN